MRPWSVRSSSFPFACAVAVVMGLNFFRIVQHQLSPISWDEPIIVTIDNLPMNRIDRLYAITIQLKVRPGCRL